MKANHKSSVAHAIESVKPEIIRKSFVTTDKDAYFTVVDGKGKFLFASVKNGELQFTEKIIHKGREIYPQTLPISNGEMKPIVGVPNKVLMDYIDRLDAKEIFGEIKSHLRRYLDASESEYDLLTYYILFTWFYSKVNTLLYVRFRGDTGKGKSRFLTIVSNLCFYPIKASGASTASGAIRLNERWHGTLAIDEADLDGGAQNPFVKYINIGFEKHNATFVKCMPSDYEEPEIFDAFCPKIFAMREHFKDNATEGRVCSFTPRQTMRKDIPVILPQSYEFEVDLLRAQIATMVLFNWNKVDGNKLLDCQEFDIESRIKQIMIPMSIVCQLLPEGESVLKDYLIHRQKELKEVRSQSFEGAAFNHVYALATGDEVLPEGFKEFATGLGIAAVTPAMVAEGLRTDAKSVTRALQSIGMVSENNRVRLADGKSCTKRHYTVPDGDRWAEMVQRYWISSTEGDLQGQIPECPEALKSKNYKEHAE